MARIIDAPLTGAESGCDPRALHGAWGSLNAAAARGLAYTAEVKTKTDALYEKVKQVVLGPPYSYHPPTDQTGGIYTLRLRMDRLAKLSREIFGSESTYPGPTASNPTPTSAASPVKP